jgi:hypothetical protein
LRIEDVPEVPVTKLESLATMAPREQQKRRRRAAQPKPIRHRTVLVDRKTVITDTEMHKRINKMREAAMQTVRLLDEDESAVVDSSSSSSSSDDDDEEAEQQQHPSSHPTLVHKRRVVESHFLDEMFRSARRANAVKIAHQHLLCDLFKMPSGSMSRNAHSVSNPKAQQRFDISSQLIAGNMKTTRQHDHKFLYCVSNREQDEQKRTDIETTATDKNESSSSQQSDVYSMMRQHASRRAAKKRRVSDLIPERSPPIDQQQLIWSSDAHEQFAVPDVPVMTENELPMQAQQLNDEPSFVYCDPQPPPVIVEKTQRDGTSLGPVEDYETILINGIKAARKRRAQPELRDIIASAALTQRSKESDKPRRFMAIRLLTATLSNNLFY